MREKILFGLILCLILSFVSCDNVNKVQYVEIETEFGTMKAELYNSTPQHRDNFIKMAEGKFYDNLLFHRVIPGFMVQGGDPKSKNAGPTKRLGGGGPGYTLPAEIGAPHFKGTLAAARTGGSSNPEKRSSGSQFYIVQGAIQSDQELQNFERTKKIKYNEAQRKIYKERGGYPSLDLEYTVFGEIIEGLEVIDKLAAVETGVADRPIEDVKMKVRLVN